MAFEYRVLSPRTLTSLPLLEASYIGPGIQVCKRILCGQNPGTLVHFERLTELRPIGNVGPADLDTFNRVCIFVSRQSADFVQAFQSGNHVTKDRVLSVLGGDWPQADVELASVGLTGRIDPVPAGDP